MRPRDVERKVIGTTTKRSKLHSLSSPPPPPPQTLPILPDELIVEILLRLPVRSLLQFKRVCKSWKTIISSHQFAKDHLQRSTADPTASHPRLSYSNKHEDIWRIGFFSAKSLFENPSSHTKVVCFKMACCADIVGSCNGLLCVRDLFRVRLWNPCTGLASEWLEIENPTKEYILFGGFGYDHVHNKYKFIVIVPITLKSVTRLYTFGSNSWKTIHFPVHGYHCEARFLSGTLHWIAGVPGTSQLMILSFDLAKETFGQMSLPHLHDDNLSMPELGVLRNRLCVCFEDNKESSHWAMWLMKEYGVEQSWTKLVMIPREEPSYFRVRWIPSLQPLCVSENDVVLAILPFSSKLVLCNSTDGRLDYPHIDSSSDGELDHPMTNGAGDRILHIFHESLVSPSHCGLQSCSFGLTVD